MRDATLDVIESLRNYLDRLGIEPSKDIFEDIDKLINKDKKPKNDED